MSPLHRTNHQTPRSAASRLTRSTHQSWLSPSTSMPPAWSSAPTSTSCPSRFAHLRSTQPLQHDLHYLYTIENTPYGLITDSNVKALTTWANSSRVPKQTSWISETSELNPLMKSRKSS